MGRRRSGLARFGLPRLRRRVLWVGLVVLLAAAGIGLEQARRHPAADADWTTYDRRQVRVVEVVDGDSLRIDLPDRSGKPTQIRLLGIDTPEMRTQDGGPEYWGDRATEYTRARAAGQEVTLRLDEIKTRDKYQRLLAYVYLPNNELLNESILRDGQGYLYRSQQFQLMGQFERAESTARNTRRGLWKEVKIEQMPRWRRDWMAERGITSP